MWNSMVIPSIDTNYWCFTKPIGELAYGTHGVEGLSGVICASQSRGHIRTASYLGNIILSFISKGFFV